jgi:atlastin
MEQFSATPKMGGEEISSRYAAELEKKIDNSYESFVKRNESKHILNAYRTPGVLGAVMVLSYLISSILDMIGVESLSQTAIFGLYVPLLMLLLWMYIRYSGEWRELGQMIDNITTAIWEQVLWPHETHTPAGNHSNDNGGRASNSV